MYAVRTIGGIAGVLLLVGAGCMSAADHQARLGSEADRQLTVGTVQKAIHIGMGAEEVAKELGSPNIVTKNRDGDETWIYDRLATEVSYSRDSGGIGIGAGAAGVPGTTMLIGLGGGSYSREAGARSRTQRTLTVIINFDEDSRVKDFSYHASRF